MISSTAIDLPEHGEQVRQACLCQGVYPIYMEALPARDANAVKVSLEMVDNADVYIGIFACRYGYIPEGGKISITEMEFNRAVERKLPIFVFTSHKDHLFTSEMLEANSSAQKKLKKLKEHACNGRGRCEFESVADLRGKVIHALADYKMRKAQSVSPVEAILKEQKHLEELDPKASVKITATGKSIHYQVHFRNSKLEILNAIGKEQLEAFFEKGQSVQINLKDIPTNISPLLNELLGMVEDTNLIIQSAVKRKGCVQLAFQSLSKEPITTQIDGEWLMAPKKVEFKGQLSDSPFYIQYIREFDAAKNEERYIINVKYDFGAWNGQPLLALPYYSEINDFTSQNNFTIRSFINGNQYWLPDKLVVAGEERKRAVEALGWLGDAREAAKYLRVNPSFLAVYKVNSIDSPSDDVQLMVKLIKSGIHQQSNKGEALTFSCENENPNSKTGEKQMTACWEESIRKIRFFGIEVPFGPINHTCTDMELVKVHPLEGNRAEMIFKGGENSIWKMEYKRLS